MRLRTVSYTPSPSSVVYQCGQVSIRLLRASVYHWATLLTRFQAMTIPAGNLTAQNIASAVMLHILWDDETVEWDRSYDGDALLEMTDAELLEVGTLLAKELYSVATLRFGLDVMQVMDAMTKNLSGEHPNAQALPTQN